MQLNRESQKNFKPIYDLAEIFVHHKLGVARDHIVQHCRMVGEKVLNYSHEYGCLDETRQELQSVLTSLDPAIRSRISRLLRRILEQQQSQLKPEKKHNTEASPTMIQAHEESFQPIKRKRGGEWGVPWEKSKTAVQNST